MLFRKPSETATLIKSYKKFRKSGRHLMDAIIQSAGENSLKPAAKLLGVLQGNTMTMESEEETFALMDFMIFDCRVDGKNLIERYQEEHEITTEEDRALVASWLASRSSLFRVVDVLRSENLLVLTDVLTGEDGIRLLDTSFSQTCPPGLLIFTRLAPFQGVNITTGNNFVFAGDREKHLLTKYKSLVRKVKSDDERIQQFVCFFKLNRTYGIETRYR